MGDLRHCGIAIDGVGTSLIQASTAQMSEEVAIRDALWGYGKEGSPTVIIKSDAQELIRMINRRTAVDITWETFYMTYGTLRVVWNLWCLCFLIEKTNRAAHAVASFIQYVGEPLYGNGIVLVSIFFLTFLQKM